jgi:sirohydrochlorin ferrochelatase
MHRTLVDLVDNRIVSALKENEISLSKDKVDVLVIGHGSMDPNAGISINYIVDELRKSYKNVDRCYLEIEEPNIEQGIQSCQNNNPDVLVIVFYFLHEGAHVKTDINNDLKPALEKSNLKKVCVTKHLGADEKMIDLIVERAKEVENAN